MLYKSINYGVIFGVTDGTRTRDDRNHNPGLYQLSYSHHSIDLIYITKAAHYT